MVNNNVGPNQSVPVEDKSALRVSGMADHNLYHTDGFDHSTMLSLCN